MDNVKTITALTQLFDDLLISGDYPGLEALTGTRRDRNGDLLVDFLPLDSPHAPPQRGRHLDQVEMVTFRIQITTVR